MDGTFPTQTITELPLTIIATISCTVFFTPRCSIDSPAERFVRLRRPFHFNTETV
jgi:hypothetical protein